MKKVVAALITCISFAGSASAQTPAGAATNAAIGGLTTGMVAVAVAVAAVAVAASTDSGSSNPSTTTTTATH